jgi:HAD superfamily hydrolase (TIGR01484 family)
VELIVFDLDGTLLNQESVISDYTSETLKFLAEQEIAYTVATGRTLHSARTILEGHQLLLPQAYKNGLMIWHPEQRRFSSRAMLTADELDHIVQACIRQAVTPFVFTLDEDQESTVYHPPLQSEVEQRQTLPTRSNPPPRPSSDTTTTRASHASCGNVLGWGRPEQRRFC